MFTTEAGTPEGGIISPTLANLTLDGLEQLLPPTFRNKKVGGMQHNPKVNFVRYADDFIITGSSKDLLENEVKPLAERSDGSLLHFQLVLESKNLAGSAIKRNILAWRAMDYLP